MADEKEAVWSVGEDMLPVLRAVHCSSCGAEVFPAQTYGCIRCGADGSSLEPLALGTSGTLMSFAVVPLGVLAALYLREYARQGALVRMVRIAVNNLAGVPSIVFGVFGLGFFCYAVGGSIDDLFFAARCGGWCISHHDSF